MPYVIIKTDNAAGQKKLLVVPETWVESKAGQGEYLRWPDAKSIKNLKELLENEKSIPAAVWEKRKCNIIYQHVPSLASGEKTIEIMQNSIPAGKGTSTSTTKSMEWKTAKDQKNEPGAYHPPSKGTLIVVEETQPSQNLQDLLSVVIPKEEIEDSFEDSNDLLRIEPLNVLTERDRQSNEQNLMSLLGIEETEYEPFNDVLPSPSAEVSQSSASKVAGKSSAKIDPPRNPSLNVIEAKQLRDLDIIEYDPFEEVSPSPEVSHPPSKPRVNVIDAKQLIDDAQRFFSDASKEADSEPSVEIQSFSQLIDMVQEIKFMIEKSQKDIKKIVSNAMYKMTRSINMLLDGEVTGMPIDNLSDDNEGLKFDVLTSVEAVENFEERLKDEKYLKEIHSWVDSCVRFEGSAQHRMHKMLDLIFDRKLFAKFSWSGRYKLPMQKYTNILKLFEYIGTNGMERVERAHVEIFFKGKLTHAYARVHITSTDRSHPKKRKTTLQTCDQGQASKSKTGPTEEISNASEFNVNVQGASHRGTVEQQKGNLETGQASTALPSTSKPSVKVILPVVNVNPIKSTIQLDGFESALNDVKKKIQVHRWVDRTVGQIADAEQRMKVLLERLIDRNALQNFCWMDTGSGKRRLDQYKNFIRLFEYASRTMVSNTVLFHHELVASFFAKTLDHVS
ncbi:uncharacterized protein LOC133392838 isoform X3 [Anopheles gambiae]|uniref:uncharacterized protein LOC133392838 isoform X3 n=1 Tax=Anopheles gambiae TaxID=7165 RepID=UPI002AC91571|nr:uncharacterized protein LOC133392838 isoform X3 [Anopheles gambiae]XP_061510760.1 uncharacterized protein LOC133392838 isoform X3 [Anopheles gambiae]XP_061510762.1 uncharacterized protein LOC133392838 isoform X3 [Anopheles gambiae]